MSLTKLEHLIKLATESQEPGEAESAALQACRFIVAHKIQFVSTVRTQGKRATQDWLQSNDPRIEHECNECNEPIPAGEQHWQSLSSRLRYHGGCV